MASIVAVKLKSSTLSGGTIAGASGLKTGTGVPICAMLFKTKSGDSAKRRFFTALLIFPFSMSQSPSRVTPV